jgi:hypothetical protein
MVVQYCDVQLGETICKAILKSELGDVLLTLQESEIVVNSRNPPIELILWMCYDLTGLEDLDS